MLYVYMRQNSVFVKGVSDGIWLEKYCDEYDRKLKCT